MFQINYCDGLVLLVQQIAYTNTVGSFTVFRLVCTYPCHHLPSILAVNSASNEGNPTLIIVLPIIIVLLITSLVIAVIIIWICVERFRKMKHSTCGKTNKQM